MRLCSWNIGEAAVFVWGVGLLPFKDTFMSNRSQVAPTHANTGKDTGGFKGFHEEAPELHAISALLSAGPGKLRPPTNYEGVRNAACCICPAMFFVFVFPLNEATAWLDSKSK